MSENKTVIKKLHRKPWPEDCPWPEPLCNGEGMRWEADMVGDLLDEEAQDLLEIKEYFDSMVECGRLHADYTLNEAYGDIIPDGEYGQSDEEKSKDGFYPELGEEYWDGEEQKFFPDWWEEDLSNHMNRLKIDLVPFEKDPVAAVREIIGYEFVNENLLRQAFTRRAFALEYGLPGCNEELEFLGDTVLNTVVTREIMDRLAHVDVERTGAPFIVRCQEGGLTMIRSRFVSKEYLADRASVLGLDALILYGTGEEATEGSREDMMEALLGAVTVDCNWNWDVIAGVVDKLVCVQVNKPDEFLKESYYEIFNAWHQRHFGTVPEYEIHGYKDRFDCALRYQVPANDKGIEKWQRVYVFAATRSGAREQAAWEAYRFVCNNGLWINLKESGIMPEPENSINQLQELYQKKYLEQAPVYEFEERELDQWYCLCVCGGVSGTGQAIGKTKAKKQAAFKVLKQLFAAAGVEF